MEYRPYMKQIQDKLGQIKAADRIQEDPWFDVVVRELNDLSRQCADELEGETGIIWNKGTYQLRLHEAPPARILGLVISLVPWLGWIMHEKQQDENEPFSTTDCWRRIEEAYQYGVALSRARQRP